MGQHEAGTFPRPEDDASEDGIREIKGQISEMRSMLLEMRTEILSSRAEIRELREELQAARQQVAAAGAVVQPAEERLQKVEEEQHLLGARLEEQYQTKVESASKYRVQLSGMVLLNLFRNTGVVDNLDFPNFALEKRPIDTAGSFGGSLRQSVLGLEVFGPRIGGARIGGEIQFDFAGGFPAAPDGAAFGLLRLRTGVLRAAWPNTSVVAGQDLPFFSPLSPSSLASLALPAFSYAGNLWTWLPQVRLEHRVNLDSASSVLLQGGILDPMTGEYPAYQFLRAPQAGEASRQPAYATRVAWSRSGFDRQVTLGFGGYYSRQNWGFQRNVDAWAGTADWIVPLSDRWEFSGEYYHGRAIGGLGGGTGRSIVMGGPIAESTTQVSGLNSTGGWAQLKFRQTEKLEWNGAVGMDNPRASDLRLFPRLEQGNSYPSTARNRNALVNVIYRPRSDLLLSLEYRRLRTFTIRNSNTADQINLSMGVLF